MARESCLLIFNSICVQYSMFTECNKTTDTVADVFIIPMAMRVKQSLEFESKDRRGNMTFEAASGRC